MFKGWKVILGEKYYIFKILLPMQHIFKLLFLVDKYFPKTLVVLTNVRTSLRSPHLTSWSHYCVQRALHAGRVVAYESCYESCWTSVWCSDYAVVEFNYLNNSLSIFLYNGGSQCNGRGHYLGKVVSIT